MRTCFQRYCRTSFFIVPVLFLLCLADTPVTQAQERYSYEITYHPILPYIFFDSLSAEIPARYHQFMTASERASFSDSTLTGNDIDIHHHLLNIIGYRMTRFPEAVIRLTGHTGMAKGATLELANQRTQNVLDYLVNIWGINPARITFETSKEYPKYRSNPRDSKFRKENFRVEIATENFDLLRPVRTIAWSDSTTTQPAITYQIRFIHFIPDSDEMGSVDERIFNEYILSGVTPDSRIFITGDEAWAGNEDRCIRLSLKRAGMVERSIKEHSLISKIRSIATGKIEHPRFPLDTPEGTMLSRGVTIRIASESSTHEPR